MIGDFAEQGCVTERLEDVAGDGRPGCDLLIDEVLAIGDRPDRPDELARSRVVEDVRRGACLDGREQLVVTASVAERARRGSRGTRASTAGRRG